MHVWDLERGTIKQFADDMEQSGGLTTGEHYYHLLAAIWLGGLAATDKNGNPITPEMLRNRLRLFDNRWCGTTEIVVEHQHKGKTLRALLGELFPTVKPDALARMVNGYPPPEIAAHERIPFDSEKPPKPERHIFVDGAPTRLSARLLKGQVIDLPACEPFISDVPFDRLAKLPWPEGYSRQYRSAYIEQLFMEPKAVSAWLDQLTKGKAPIPTPRPLRGHAFRSATKKWYRDDWVKGSEWRAWLADNGRPTGATPSADDDLKAAREKLGQAVSRDDIRGLRQEFAPPEWKRPGKPANP